MSLQGHTIQQEAKHRERGLCSQSNPHKAVFPQETKLCKELIPDFTLTPWADVTVVNTLKVAQCTRNELRMHKECEKGQYQSYCNSS